MKINICRSCNERHVSEIIDFGRQPIVHHLPEKQGVEEYIHPLAINICRDCGIAFIPDPCPPEKLYLDYNYNFSHWKSEPHMEAEIAMIVNGCNGLSDSIFEIGCNDGTFISNFDGVNRRVGMEPNLHPAKLSEQKGIKVIKEFLSREVSEKIITEYGCFDLVVARQVLEHLQDYSLFFQCLDILLSDRGYVFVDVPDSENGFQQGDCSIIWEEHVVYFSENTLKNLFFENGFELVDIKKFNFSGGIVSCLFRKLKNKKKCPDRQDVGSFINDALSFGKKVENYRGRLSRLLTFCKQQNQRVIVYGVGCRGSLFVNGLKLASMIDFAVDDQEERQGKYMAGSQLPIRSSRELGKINEKMLILLAVGQENDEKVKTKIRRMTSPETCEILSVCSPADIFSELKTVESKISK